MSVTGIQTSSGFVPFGGGNSGHIIENYDGTVFPQRSKLQFKGFILSDDSTNDRTIIRSDFEPELVSWSSGTDVQIINMVNSYYRGIITLDDVKSVWSVGDEREFTLTDNSTLTFVIIDFNHDELTTPINGKTNSLITCNAKIQYIYHVINDTDTTAGGWERSSMRDWCNNTFYNIVPYNWKNIIKTVKKYTSIGEQSTTVTAVNDNVWILSEVEIFGTATNSVSTEADYSSQYKYYETSSNRAKKNNAINMPADWWTRSPYKSHNGKNVRVSASGTTSYFGTGGSGGTVPAICL